MTLTKGFLQGPRDHLADLRPPPLSQLGTRHARATASTARSGLRRTCRPIDLMTRRARSETRAPVENRSGSASASISRTGALYDPPRSPRLPFVNRPGNSAAGERVPPSPRAPSTGPPDHPVCPRFGHVRRPVEDAATRLKSDRPYPGLSSAIRGSHARRPPHPPVGFEARARVSVEVEPRTRRDRLFGVAGVLASCRSASRRSEAGHVCTVTWCHQRLPNATFCRP